MEQRTVCLLSTLLVLTVFSATVLSQPSLAAGDGYYPRVKNQPIPRTADGKPDLSGFWAEWRRVAGLPNAVGEAAAARWKEFPSPKLPRMDLTPWGAERHFYNQDPLYDEGEDRVRNELDPSSHCFPVGTARLGAPFQILPTEGRIFILYEENHEVRQIFTDGRGHPEDLELTWNGHSIGHWDGDTLVIETIGLRDETLLDGGGHVHSTELRIEERIRRIAYDVLEIESTLTDPKALSKPFKRYQTYPLAPPNWHLAESNNCEARYQRGVWFGEGPSGF